MTESTEGYLRRKEAARYVVETYNVPCSPRTLAKLACISSEGPPFRKAGRFPLYPISGLDAWALAKFGPLVRSTSELPRKAAKVGAYKADYSRLTDEQLAEEDFECVELLKHSRPVSR